MHTYYDDWHLTGLHLTEEHSAKMALVYEDPVETAQLDGGTDAPFYLDVQYGLLYGLDQTLLAGRCSPANADGSCPAGATRDFTVSDIYTRFNHTTNAGVSADDRWNLPNVLSVVQNEYEALDLGMSDTTITQTVTILNDHFTARGPQAHPDHTHDHGRATSRNIATSIWTKIACPGEHPCGLERQRPDLGLPQSGERCRGRQHHGLTQMDAL